MSMFSQLPVVDQVVPNDGMRNAIPVLFTFSHYVRNFKVCRQQDLLLYFLIYKMDNLKSIRVWLELLYLLAVENRTLNVKNSAFHQSNPFKATTNFNGERNSSDTPSGGGIVLLLYQACKQNKLSKQFISLLIIAIMLNIGSKTGMQDMN